LASAAAAEVATALSVIGVRARLIAAGESTGAEAQANAKAILDQSARMTVIVRQLLDYARRQGSQTGLVDLRHVVTGALGMLEPLVQKQEVQIDVSLPEQPLLGAARLPQLQQAVTNVAMNGMQAMSSGGRLRVEVGCGPASSPVHHAATANDWAWIRISEDGPGGRAQPRVRGLHSGTTAPAPRASTGPTSASRSTRPRRWGRGPVSASPWC